MAGNHIPHGHPQRQKNLASFMQGSHVIDENNNPLRLYHGTADDFDEFKHGHMNKKDAGWLGRGFYFTNSPSLANSYAMIKRGKSENVMPVHLALKNPFYATTEHKAALKQALEKDPFAAEDFRNKLIDAGHDGVILDYGTPDKVREYVAFNPNQIKSAIGNRGTFDPTNPNITKADGGIVGDPDTDEGITAYHGSPYDFERFDMSKIGTGEGNQSYGHGLYFAQNEDVAKGYRPPATEDRPIPVTIDGQKINAPTAMQKLVAQHRGDVDAVHKGMTPNWNRAASEFRVAPQDPDDLEYILAEVNHQKALNERAEVEAMRGKKIAYDYSGHQGNQALAGRTYEVHINAKPDHFLDWDRPVREQPHIMKAIDDHIGDPSSILDQLFGHQDATGRDLHEKFGGEYKPKAVADKFYSMGIKGIKYADDGSVNPIYKGSQNYVVFDDKLVNVKRKYAKGGTVQRSPNPVSDGSIVSRALMLTSKKA